MKMPKTSTERRKAKKAAYLEGRARNPHHHTPILNRSLEEGERSIESPSSSILSSARVCQQCKHGMQKFLRAWFIKAVS